MRKLALLIMIMGLVATLAHAQLIETLDNTGQPRPLSEAWPMPNRFVMSPLGFAASFTVVIDASSTYLVSSLGTYSSALLWVSGDCNYGGSDIIQGTTGLYIPADCPNWPVSFATSTPRLYLRSRVGSITVRVYKGI